MQSQTTHADSKYSSTTVAELVRPTRDFVLLQPEPAPDKQGLIHIPRTAKNQRYRGTIIAVGPGRVTEHGIRVPVDVRPGDRVIYSKHNMAQGISHALDDNGPILVPEMDIEAVVEVHDGGKSSALGALL